MAMEGQGGAPEDGETPRGQPVADAGRLAMDLMRLAAGVLERGQQLEVLNAAWVDRHVWSVGEPTAKAISKPD